MITKQPEVGTQVALTIEGFHTTGFDYTVTKVTPSYFWVEGEGRKLRFQQWNSGLFRANIACQGAPDTYVAAIAK